MSEGVNVKTHLRHPACDAILDPSLGIRADCCLVYQHPLLLPAKPLPHPTCTNIMVSSGKAIKIHDQPATTNAYRFLEIMPDAATATDFERPERDNNSSVMTHMHRDTLADQGLSAKAGESPLKIPAGGLRRVYGDVLTEHERIDLVRGYHPSSTLETKFDKNATNTSHASFLSLPAEIRNHIYHDALVEVEPIRLISIHKLASFIIEPALLLTTKQVRSDALPVFYGANTFRSLGSDALEKFLQQCSNEKLSLLRFLHCISRSDADAIMADMLMSKRVQVEYRKKGNDMHRWLVEQYLQRVRKQGEKLMQIGEEQGVNRGAMLLPIYAPTPDICFDSEWVTLDEYKQYTVRNDGGNIEVVRSGGGLE